MDQLNLLKALNLKVEIGIISTKEQLIELEVRLKEINDDYWAPGAKESLFKSISKFHVDLRVGNSLMYAIFPISGLLSENCVMFLPTNMDQRE
jgi:hypothetical protein